MLPYVTVPPTYCSNGREILVPVMFLVNTRSLVPILLIRKPECCTICFHDLFVCGSGREKTELAMLVLFEEYDIHHPELHRAFRLVLCCFDRVLPNS